jgi:subtilisin-like proprotein convertase family protein
MKMNNRVINRLAATAAVALVAAAGQAQVFSTSPFIAIPDPPATLGTVSSTLDVAGAATITDLNVIIDITHTFTGDLDIILVPPSNDRYIHLTSDNGGAGDNFTFTRFDQSSPLAISAGVAPAVAPFNGTFRPEGGDVLWRAAASIPLPGFSLAGLDDVNGTDPNGTWTLIIDDDAGGDIGTLNYWSIELNGAVDPQGPSFGLPPTATDTSTPATVSRDGTQTVTLRATVSAGSSPDSTGLTVVADASSVGGSGSLNLLDNGVFPDEVAGDNIYTAIITIPYTAPTGLRTLPYVVSDDQSRTFSDAFTFTVTEANGACCTSSGCIVTSVGDCIDVQGGTFAGNNTACFTPLPMTTEGAGAFEDISATGTSPGLAGVDDGVVNITLPFTFNFFGTDYTSGNMSSNGNFQFGTNNSTSFSPGPIPSAGIPNNALYVLWDDLDMDVTGTAFIETRGTPGVDERFIIQWNTIGQYNVGLTPLDSNTFQIVLFPDGNFEYRYQTIAPETTVGDLTIIGFENQTGTTAVTLPETRDSLAASAPISFRGNSQGQDTGVCDGGSGCAECAADYDQDGGVTGADIAAFFADFEAGAICADVDQDGGVTGGDIGAFFLVFEAGGC